MPRAYSLDLRERVIAAAEAGDLTRAEIARRFRISEATVYDWLKRWREQGSIEPTPQRHGPEPTLGPAEHEVLGALVEETNDRTLEEYAALLCERTGVARLSPSTLWRALDRLEITRKKRHSGPASEIAPT